MLNAGGLLYAIITGEWRLKQMYEWFYFPIAGTMWALGALGLLPRVKRIDEGRGPRAPLLLWIGVGGDDRAAGAVVHVEVRCRAAPRFDVFKLVVFIGILAFVGNMARLGLLPRTRPIVPGELAVSD